MGNYLKTAVLMAGLTALFLAIGQRFGGPQGMFLAGMFAVVLNFGTYWFSDRIALAMNGAQPIAPHQLPWLHEMVGSLARKAGIPKPRLYLMSTSMPNAFATGRNPSHSAVAVTEGILQILDQNELRGVIAHELAHIKNRDTLISTIAATMAGIITHAVQMAFWFGGGSRDDDDSGSALGGIALLIVAPFAAMLLQMAISRSREFGADAVGAQISSDPHALANALEKLEQGARAIPYARAPATASLFIVNPLRASSVASLFSTHPPTAQRIQRLRSMGSRIPNRRSWAF